MKSASGHPTTRREKTVRHGPFPVKVERPNCDCDKDLAARLTEVVERAARIRGAVQLAVSELIKTLSLIERATFAVFRTASVIWLLYFIFVHHSHIGGVRDFILSVFSGVVLLQHLIEIVRRISGRQM